MGAWQKFTSLIVHSLERQWPSLYDECVTSEHDQGELFGPGQDEEVDRIWESQGHLAS